MKDDRRSVQVRPFEGQRNELIPLLPAKKVSEYRHWACLRSQLLDFSERLERLLSEALDCGFTPKQHVRCFCFLKEVSDRLRRVSDGDGERGVTGTNDSHQSCEEGESICGDEEWDISKIEDY